jgi:hypothetical protein
VDPPRITFKTVRVGYLISLYVQWNGRNLTLSDDITPETITAMVLAHTPADDDWLVGWKDEERRPGNAAYIAKYHDTRNSVTMAESVHVPRLTEYPWGKWVPTAHRIARIESTIAGRALEGMVCTKCHVHNPYAEVDVSKPYICRGCKSWSGTVFTPAPPAIPSERTTKPSLGSS